MNRQRKWFTLDQPMHHGLRLALDQTITASKIQLLWCKLKMNLDNRENRRLTKAASPVVNQITCIWGDILQTEQRVSRHTVMWLIKVTKLSFSDDQQNRNPRSSKEKQRRTSTKFTESCLSGRLSCNRNSKQAGHWLLYRVVNFHARKRLWRNQLIFRRVDSISVSGMFPKNALSSNCFLLRHYPVNVRLYYLGNWQE